MIKLRIQNEKPNPVPVRWARVWNPEPDLWVIGIDSPSDSLQMQAHTDGAVVYSPFGEGTPVRVVAEFGDPKFTQARIWTSIDRHHGIDHKYFLVKWFCRDEDWQSDAEDAAMNRGLAWIDSGVWRTDTGVGVARGTI